MARRNPTLVVLLPLLAACATTAPTTDRTGRSGETHLDTSPDGVAVYLEGLTTRYSVRLDELRASHARTSATENRLPNAVVAGDANMTVAGALFHHPEVFAADLIIRNHGDAPLEVDRAQIELIDDEGRTLIPRLDWEHGADYGLRALQADKRIYRHMGTDHQAGQAGMRDERPTKTLGKSRTAESGASQSALQVGETPMDVSWISELDRERALVTVPTMFVLEPGEFAPYWVYWDTAEVSYPVTLSVRMGGKRMLLRFDEPQRTMIAR